ncbi:DNA-binding MarR family transcriptional regulator [Mesonia hippocampi]|uniref:DNA-binding MarR family transcriptional regulator n=1 Tax=Mesonia hippocampi TaxID=1628250 RepID=A0A840ELH4_9FLAO|nr:MarR family transcriptional regulator [Mesonia hippocampi]MBB4118978.1 DNA-binding MarR family transcriptional regulator [Mesonia hippocampi]
MNVEEIIKTNVKLSLTKQLLLNLFISNADIIERLALLLKQHEISQPQFNVLRILRGQKDTAVNMADIQERMIHKKSNTTRIVDKLIEKQLVERSTCPNNRRKVEVFITKNGLDLLEKIDPELDKEEKEITRNLNSEDKKVMIQLLEKLRESNTK